MTTIGLFKKWRDQARDLLKQGIAPEGAQFDLNQIGLFKSSPKAVGIDKPIVPPEFLKAAELVAHSQDEDRYELLYRVLFRLQHENPQLMKILVDNDVSRLLTLAKNVSHDIHKMHAFVRFKQVDIEGVTTYQAWHQPRHYILELAAPFFVRRFGDRPWSIFTPDDSAHWDLETLTFCKGMTQEEFKATDPFDEVWKTYYRSIYNPARLKIKAMRREMSPEYWKSLPESSIIGELIRTTPKVLQNMASKPNYLSHPTPNQDWQSLKNEALNCRACPLGEPATQTVFGEGSLNAQIMIVGEQPGDQEDLKGQAFIGPAGKILDEALFHAGLDRKEIYVTNAVKHFKFVHQGKLRLHKKPNGSEMHACKPWLEEEIKLIKPKVILSLGATAATAVYGRLVKIQAERGQPLQRGTSMLLTSWHPAAILRSTSPEEHQERLKELIEDLKLAAELSQN